VATSRRRKHAQWAFRAWIVWIRAKVRWEISLLRLRETANRPDHLLRLHKQVGPRI
jgi:hypothetical protein